MAFPSFSVFQKELYDKIDDAERNRLFYYSLFDPSSWEESESTGHPLPDYLPSFKVRKRNILGILKKSPTIKRCFINTNSDEFFKKFANGETLSNYLLAAVILDYLRSKKITGYQPINLEKQIFPDIHLRKNPRKNVYIEIKGLVGTSNLRDRIKDEVQANLKNRGRKFKNFCLILIFPCSKNEARRINQLIKGYYVYEWIIKSSPKNNRKVLCCCIRRQNSDEFSLSELVNRIINLNYFQ
jgi:hypothetical protein